jgi:hypothetical protein
VIDGIFLGYFLENLQDTGKDLNITRKDRGLYAKWRGLLSYLWTRRTGSYRLSVALAIGAGTSSDKVGKRERRSMRYLEEAHRRRRIGVAGIEGGRRRCWWPALFP